VLPKTARLPGIPDNIQILLIFDHDAGHSDVNPDDGSNDTPPDVAFFIGMTIEFSHPNGRATPAY
jgi:hypothetical protein